jgi:hypothetical protein
MTPAAHSARPAAYAGRRAARGAAAKVVGTMRAPGGRCQVLAPAAPTRHVSAAALERAVRQVIAVR